MHGWTVGWFGHRSAFQYGGQVCSTPLRRTHALVQHHQPYASWPAAFGSVFISVRMLCECFHHHVRQPRGRLACTCSRDGLPYCTGRAKMEAELEAQPHFLPCLFYARPLLGGQRQQQRLVGE